MQRDVEVPEEAKITGDNEAATKRRQAAYDRWFDICTCGHGPESHDEDRMYMPCKVQSCGCSGFNHITGKPDHPLNPLPASDPRRKEVRSQERQRVFDEFEKRFVDGDLPERIESAVRADERQRAREALERLPRYADDGVRSEAWKIDLAGALAALDSLEDGDGKREGFEHCNRCGRGNTLWHSPSPLWNAVIRGGSIDGEPKYGDMVCATCFMELAEAAGIASHFKVFAEQVNVELETTTPSGRVWDEERQLWIDPPSDPNTHEEAGR